MEMENSIRARYSQAAREREEELCCPTDYDAELLSILPQEILEKDYGCGDPSPYVQPGDTVLDLGSGGGKICYMAAQLVGEQGFVLGVDVNDDMLALARKYQSEMAARIGGDRVRFLKAKIEDLALDMEAVEQYLQKQPVSSATDLADLYKWQAEQRRHFPAVPEASIDLVLSNCVLNLVEDRHKQAMIHEIFRVLKPGGRIAISDIVCDEPVPSHLKDNSELWSGCIAGTFQEHAFLRAFQEAGFQAVTYDKWSPEPWQVIEGIEFRAALLTAVKGEQTPCLDYGHAVIYRGPYASVTDDEGHIYRRGERTAVCERTYRLLTGGPYGEDFIGLTPAVRREPTVWCAPSGTHRPASETKGSIHEPSTRNTNSGCC